MTKDMESCRFLAYLPDAWHNAGRREKVRAYFRYVKEDNTTAKFMSIQHLEHSYADNALAVIEKTIYKHLDST